MYPLKKIVVSMLSPKSVDENYMEPIEKEASVLAERLIKYSNQENGVDPILHAHLYSMNIMFTALFSETYHGVEDKEFAALSASIVRSIVLADPARDIASIFPIYSIVDYFMGNAKEIKDYVAERDPIYQRHFNDALNKKENNFSKELQQYNFDDETKLVILGKLLLIFNVIQAKTKNALCNLSRYNGCRHRYRFCNTRLGFRNPV